MDDVIKLDIVDGVEVETVVQVDALEVAKTFPDVDDYKLSAMSSLITSSITLQERGKEGLKEQFLKAIK
jgi:predicted regulator of Ras-like GTPase activity (Roadblock/LC7/MglB family)